MTQGDTGTIEMFVASADDLDDLYHSQSLSVPPPRSSSPASFGANARGVELAEPTAWADPAEVKIMKAELSLTNAELRTVSTELERSNKTARRALGLKARELPLIHLGLSPALPESADAPRSPAPGQLRLCLLLPPASSACSRLWDLIYLNYWLEYFVVSILQTWIDWRHWYT